MTRTFLELVTLPGLATPKECERVTLVDYACLVHANKAGHESYTDPPLTNGTSLMRYLDTQIGEGNIIVVVAPSLSACGDFNASHLHGSHMLALPKEMIRIESVRSYVTWENPTSAPDHLPPYRFTITVAREPRREAGWLN